MVEAEKRSDEKVTGIASEAKERLVR